MLAPHRLADVGSGNALWAWTPKAANPSGLVVIFHGLGAHARFPTVRVAADNICLAGFAVAAPDFMGHGSSPGLRGYIPSCEALIQQAIAATEAAAAAHPGLPVFLLGSSMGGAIALAVARRIEKPVVVSGVVLLAPMLAPAISSPLAHALVTALSYSPLARVPLIPSSATDNAKQYTDPILLEEIKFDELAYKANLRVASVASVLDLGVATETALAATAVPFLCLQADRDLVLGPASKEAAGRLLETAATPKDMRFVKRYDALHGILCEPEPLRSAIVQDIVNFLRKCADP